MNKSTLQGLALSFISVGITLLGLEAALRVYHGKVLHFESFTVEPGRSIGRVVYHPRLGWVPRPGRFSTSWTSNVDPAGIRSNGGNVTTSNRPVLAIGDSFTFGDEVEDSQTWPAQLETLLRERRVINAGVGAYGIDQASLRGERLIDDYDPGIVILSFISDDIDRTEFSSYPWGRGPKPYFRLSNGTLTLHNVPVPPPPSERPLPGLRHALGYSFLASAVFRRAAPRWWQNYRRLEQVHQDGEDVSVELILRMNRLVEDREGHFIAVAFATNGRIGDNARLPSVIRRAREGGVRVLDLAAEALRLEPERFQEMFLAKGHYSPAMNAWVAGRIAGFLNELGLVRMAVSDLPAGPYHGPGGVPRSTPTG